MAGCYHDEQDFKSDLNIEVAREGDTLQEGTDLKDKNCKKNPGHLGFIPIKHLTLEHLPNENRSKEMLDRIRKMGSQVVRLVVGKIKNGKLKKEAGTGIVQRRKQTIFVIQTNNHIVKTDDDVKHCTVEFNYDGVITSKGVKLLDTCPYRDFTTFTFHPVPEFLYERNNESAPDENISKTMPDRIKMLIPRLVVDKKRKGRWIREVGYGFVQIKTQYIYVIQTNNHVVGTDDEVKHCTVEFHYDDDSRSNVLASRGVELLGTCPFRDFTFFTFHPVPEFLYQLDLVYDKVPNIKIIGKHGKIQEDEIIVFRKPNTSQTLFLSRLNLNSSLNNFMFILCHDGSFSYIKNSYFKFRPIPSDLHEFTFIEIHKDEDDGNIRVIPGCVVNFGDGLVVKIIESIFQDEVKKCRLVWNGEVIGRGTKLYFQQIKASEVYKQIDLEIGRERDIFCIFEFHPITRELEDMLIHSVRTKHLCCIGHPHGGIKMVTFGLKVGESLERFDKQYRRITTPKPDCKCKEVKCINYSCKTCIGSSGSAVIELYKGIDWGYSISHFMGESVKPYRIRGELIENKNIAWTVY